jgi:Cysteine rich repeat
MLSKTLVVAVAFTLLASAAPTFAQSHPTGSPSLSGTEQENAACRRDTRKLCRHIKADAGNGAFLSCLQEHRAKLSKACRQVLESHGM